MWETSSEHEEVFDAFPRATHNSCVLCSCLMLANEIVIGLCLWRRPACEKAEAELGPKKGEVWQPASPDGEVQQKA